MSSETAIDIAPNITEASEAPAATANGTLETEVAGRNNNNDRNVSDFGVQTTMSKCSHNLHANSNETASREDCPPPGTENVLLPPTGPEAPPPQSALTSYRAPPLVYMKDYPIQRFSRHWRRQEVQGLSCLLMEIVLTYAFLGIIALTISFALTLKALGYMENAEDGVVPNTFSRKILSAYVTQTDMSPEDNNCLYIPFNEHRVEVVTNEESDSEFKVLPSKPKSKFRREDCDCWRNISSSDWLFNLLLAHLFSVINVITASIFLCSLSARRRKGLQFFLLLPSFLCFFMNIFKTIPQTFSTGSLKGRLKNDMISTMDHQKANGLVVQVWDETQMHLQCCGINYASDWETDIKSKTFDGYPGACCNTTAFDCGGRTLIPRNYTWSVGCFHEESLRLNNYEHWGLLLLLLKVLAEVGIFCSLSDLTRYDYPPAASIENSYCEIKDYRVRCRGAMRLRGVTKDGRVVVEAKSLMPWKLEPSRTDLLTGVALYIRSSLHEVKGSVQIDKRQNIDTFVSEDIQIDLSRRHRGMFVFSLF